MRLERVLAGACLLLAAGALSAQELLPPPVANPGAPAPAAPPPSYPLPPGQGMPLGPPDGSPYVPPPAMYAGAPYPPPALIPRDPAGNPFFWIGFEGLIWWTKNQPLSIPVVTTGPASQGANAGNIGAPGTTSLNGPLNYGATGGFRLFAGGWIDTDHTIGVDGSFFILSQQSAGFSVVDRGGNGNLVINEPVVGAPFVTQVSAPGLETGGVFVNATSRFGGADVNLLYNLYRANGLTINILGGYRYLELDENLDINATSNLFVTTTYSDNMGNVLATAPPGSSVLVLDHFHTRNQFNGGQIGAQFQYLWQRWSFNGAGKIAFGATHEIVTVNGTTLVNPINATPVPLQGGNYATLQVGSYVQNRFAVAPELQLNAGYQVTSWMRAQLGYSFLFLSSVARPGQQIDNTYDGAAHPAVPMQSSSYWAQGLNLGIVFSF